MDIFERTGKTSNVSWPSVKTKIKARAYHVVQQWEDDEQDEEPEEEENECGEDLREEVDEKYQEDDDGDNNERTHRGRALTLPWRGLRPPARAGEGGGGTGARERVPAGQG